MGLKLENTKTGTRIIVEGNVRSKSQMAALKDLLNRGDIAAAAQYLETFTKRPKGNLDHIRYAKNDMRAHGIDSLKAKGPLTVLTQFNRLIDPTRSQSPSNTGLGEWVGIEIECSIPYAAFPNVSGNRCDFFCEDCQETCCGCEHDCEGNDNERNYQRALARHLQMHKVKRCTVKPDGSIDPEPNCFPAELTIVFHQADREPLRKLCTVLNRLGAKVNKSCGMHVHLDQRDILTDATISGNTRLARVGKIGLRIGQNLDFLRQLMPQSRSENHYCKLMVSETSSNGDRYCAVNMTAIHQYSTIEVRLHSATTDFTKITNWIDLLLIIKNQPVSGPVTSLEEFCSVYDVPEHLIEYCERRIAKFSKSQSVQEDQTDVQIPMAGIVQWLNDEPMALTGTES